MGALGRLALIAGVPALGRPLPAYGLPRLLRRCRDLLRRRRRQAEGPVGPPLERTAADLRRLLAEHRAVRASAAVAVRGAHLRALEAAIGDAALDAARAVGVPAPEHPGREPLSAAELRDLLAALAAAGLVLPHTRLGAPPP